MLSGCFTTHPSSHLASLWMSLPPSPTAFTGMYIPLPVSLFLFLSVPAHTIYLTSLTHTWNKSWSNAFLPRAIRHSTLFFFADTRHLHHLQFIYTYDTSHHIFFLLPSNISISHSNTVLHCRLIKLGLSIDEEEEDDSEVLPELESDDVADSSTMEEVDWEPPSRPPCTL